MNKGQLRNIANEAACYLADEEFGAFQSGGDFINGVTYNSSQSYSSFELAEQWLSEAFKSSTEEQNFTHDDISYLAARIESTHNNNVGKDDYSAFDHDDYS